MTESIFEVLNESTSRIYMNMHDCDIAKCYSWVIGQLANLEGNDILNKKLLFLYGASKPDSRWPFPEVSHLRVSPESAKSLNINYME